MPQSRITIITLSHSCALEEFIGLRILENEIGYCQSVQVGARCACTVYSTVLVD